MKSLFSEPDRRELVARFESLRPTAARQWGKMDAAQMMAHCTAGLLAATGDTPMKQKLLGRLLTPLIRGQIFGEKPFGKNAPTDPTFVMSDAREFEAERTRLLATVSKFAAQGPESAARHTHVFFGKLSGEEWGVLMHKHLDHHLRQFAS